MNLSMMCFFLIFVVVMGFGLQGDDVFDYLLMLQMIVFLVFWLFDDVMFENIVVVCVLFYQFISWVEEVGFVMVSEFDLFSFLLVVCEVINQLFGFGEVSVFIIGLEYWCVQESVFVGLWCVLKVVDDGLFIVDCLEMSVILVVLIDIMWLFVVELLVLVYLLGMMNVLVLIEEIWL